MNPKSIITDEKAHAATLGLSVGAGRGVGESSVEAEPSGQRNGSRPSDSKEVAALAESLQTLEGSRGPPALNAQATAVNESARDEPSNKPTEQRTQSIDQPELTAALPGREGADSLVEVPKIPNAT